MTKTRKGKKKAPDKDALAERFIEEAQQRGELRPKHREAFDQILDDAVLGVKKPK